MDIDNNDERGRNTTNSEQNPIWEKNTNYVRYPINSGSSYRQKKSKSDKE